MCNEQWILFESNVSWLHVSWSHGQISHGQIFISWSKFWGQIRMNMIQTPIFTVCRKNTVCEISFEISKSDCKRNLMKMSGKLFYLYYVVYLHRICNELWMKLLSLTQNPVCVSNIPQENEASVNKNTCLSFLFQLHASKDKVDKDPYYRTKISIFSFTWADLAKVLFLLLPPKIYCSCFVESNKCSSPLCLTDD